MASAVVSSPVGPLELTSDDDFVVGIRFHAAGPIGAPPVGVLTETASQLEAYFAGRLRTFDLPLNPAGTRFQRQVWDALQDLPYGTTCSYADLAGRIGRPSAIRAVGAANGRNPIPIVIPCHRVIGRDGRLVGFGGGLDAKRALLTMEGARLL